MRQYIPYIICALIAAGLAFYSQTPRLSNPVLLEEIPYEDAKAQSNFKRSTLPQISSHKNAVKASDSPNNDQSSLCLQACEKLQMAIFGPTLLSDENYESLLGETNGLAKFIYDNPALQAEFIDMALSTDDSNKRNLIIKVFQLLPKTQSEDLAFTLLNSENWQLRGKATEFFDGHDKMPEAHVTEYFNALDHEQNKFVKARLLKTLSSSHALSSNPKTIDRLNETLHHEPDGELRSAALMTKLNVVEDVSVLAQDSLLALKSGDQTFQIAGLRAYDQILERMDHDNQYAYAINMKTLLSELDSVVESARYASHDTLPLELFQEFEYIYARHSGQ